MRRAVPAALAAAMLAAVPSSAVAADGPHPAFKGQVQANSRQVYSPLHTLKVFETAFGAAPKQSKPRTSNR